MVSLARWSDEIGSERCTHKCVAKDERGGGRNSARSRGASDAEGICLSSRRVVEASWEERGGRTWMLRNIELVVGNYKTVNSDYSDHVRPAAPAAVSGSTQEAGQHWRSSKGCSWRASTQTHFVATAQAKEARCPFAIRPACTAASPRSPLPRRPLPRRRHPRHFPTGCLAPPRPRHDRCLSARPGALFFALPVPNADASQHAWDTLRQQVIEQKLVQLGVERGSGSSVPHIYAPHARAASVSLSWCSLSLSRAH